MHCYCDIAELPQETTPANRLTWPPPNTQRINNERILICRENIENIKSQNTTKTMLFFAAEQIWPTNEDNMWRKMFYYRKSRCSETTAISDILLWFCCCKILVLHIAHCFVRSDFYHQKTGPIIEGGVIAFSLLVRKQKNIRTPDIFYKFLMRGDRIYETPLTYNNSWFWL